MILRFVIISLAAARITRFITHDTMPFGSIRARLLQRWGNSMYADGLTCSYCMGAWISFALVGSLSHIVSIPLPVLYALAVSMAVGIIARYTED